MSKVKNSRIPYTCKCGRKVTFCGVEIDKVNWRCGVKGHLDITGGCGVSEVLAISKAKDGSLSIAPSES